MKKIIKGKKYDTDTAKEIGCYSNCGGWSDFNHLEETLYRKRTGEFFLLGKGGPNTKYAERVDTNCWSGGSRIMPMSYEEAANWAEEHMEVDDYEIVFGEVPEDDTRKTITVNLAVSTIETGKRMASQKNMSLSALVEELILTSQSEK